MEQLQQVEFVNLSFVFPDKVVFSTSLPSLMDFEYFDPFVSKYLLDKARFGLCEQIYFILDLWRIKNSKRY